MFLSWDGEEPRHEGFSERRLKDGRSCLLWAKGYFFDANGRMWFEDQMVDWLSTQLADHRLPDLVPGMNGCFAITLYWPAAKTIEVGIDRYGPIPIYYHVGDHRLLLSDDFWQVASRIAFLNYDPDAVMSMVLLGYVAGNGTLLAGVKELAQATTHCLSFVDGTPRLVSRRYWMFSYHADSYRTREMWRATLAGTLDDVLARYAQAAVERNWHVNIPLSGGIDSRLLTGMFCRKGASVRVFSYGPTGNEESQLASRVADALGIPFKFVPIDDPSCLPPTLIQAMTRLVGMKTRFTAGIGGRLLRADFSAQDAYALGHPGDLTAGFDIKRGTLLVHSEEQTVQHLIDIHALPLFDEVAEALFPSTWQADSKTRLVVSDWHFDADDPVGSVCRWAWEQRCRRLLLSEARAYGQMGHWLLPYCDHKLVDFFAGAPRELLYQRRLHLDTLIHNVFVDDLACLVQIPKVDDELETFHLPALSWRDRVAMKMPKQVIGDWVLKRGSRSKHLAYLRSVGMRSAEPGADPWDHWWYDFPSFRQSLIDSFRSWDGLHGLVDTSVLASVLEQPQPSLFLQCCVPALVTLRYFQQIVEQELRPGHMGDDTWEQGAHG